MMQQELIITKNDLSIVDATPGCRYFIKGTIPKKKRNIFEYIPVLQTILNPQILREGGVLGGIALETKIYSIRVLPAENLITFIFQEQDEPLAVAATVHEITKLRER